MQKVVINKGIAYLTITLHNSIGTCMYCCAIHGQSLLVRSLLTMVCFSCDKIILHCAHRHSVHRHSYRISRKSFFVTDCFISLFLSRILPLIMCICMLAHMLWVGLYLEPSFFHFLRALWQSTCKSTEDGCQFEKIS